MATITGILQNKIIPELQEAATVDVNQEAITELKFGKKDLPDGGQQTFFTVRIKTANAEVFVTRTDIAPPA